jgi:hypothetical protein
MAIFRIALKPPLAVPLSLVSHFWRRRRPQGFPKTATLGRLDLDQSLAERLIDCFLIVSGLSS